MILIAILLLLIALLGNLIVYGILFYVVRILVRSLIARFAPVTERQWPVKWISVALVAAIAFGFPLVANLIRQYERAALVREDMGWDGKLTGAHTVALLTDSVEDKNWHKPGECGPLRCRQPLYHHVVDAILTGSPPSIGARLDPAMTLTRYRLDRRPSCPPIENLERANGRNLDELAGAAAGECLIAEPATLESADAIVLDQRLNPDNRPNYHTVHEPLIGERISVYLRDGKGWRELYQKTTVGGSDWFIPVLVGPLNRNLFGAMMFGGGMMGFMTSSDIDPPPLSLDSALKHWGIGEHDGTVPSDSELSALAKKVLADETIPQASAAMQFLASYAWEDEGDWRVSDIETVAEIIRDRRVTDFPFVPWRKITPLDLARPILDRVLSTDPSPADESTRRRNRYAIKVLAQAFSQLPPCAAAPLYADLHRLAFDETRRQYAAAMFSRLGDAGTIAVGDLKFLVETAIVGGHPNHVLEWQSASSQPDGDGQVVVSAFNGLAKIGPGAKSVAPVIVDALKDKRADTFPALRTPGYVALISIGDMEALRQVYQQLYLGPLNDQTISALMREMPKGSGTSCRK